MSALPDYEPVELAIAKAREPRPTKAYERGGAVAEKTSRPVRCEWRSGNGCPEISTNQIFTKSQRRDYCAAHAARILTEMQSRRPKRLSLDLKF